MFSKSMRLGFVILAVAAVTGCGETIKPAAQAPQLPSTQSMLPDLSFFNSKNAQGVTETAANRLNFFNAIVRVQFVNLIVVDVLTPPTLAFAAALNTIPSIDEDGSYLWIYTWVDQGLDHQIRLRGTEVGNTVDWELSVVLPGADPEVWFTGRSHTDRDEGYWVFNDFSAPGDPEVLRVDWEAGSKTDARLLFTNVEAGNDEEGDQLEYLVDGSIASIEFRDASSGEDWDIVWDESDGSGSLRVPDYNNGKRACWDTDQENVECPAEDPAILAQGTLR